MPGTITTTHVAPLPHRLYCNNGSAKVVIAAQAVQAKAPAD
jgi:hypothetical protein